MGDIIIFLPIIIIAVIGFFIIPLIKMFANTFGTDSAPSANRPKDAKYNRQVHQMHAKDAASERKHYLDQLKSLYEAGMMERDEYNERVEAIEADYRGKY
ncbi:MAG: hypothetical protein IKD39_01135 [Oscillospiraceae bacterium]|nr:hypothetical protein [Oscillospiraceae bacterium]